MKFWENDILSLFPPLNPIYAFGSGIPISKRLQKMAHCLTVGESRSRVPKFHVPLPNSESKSFTLPLLNQSARKGWVERDQG